MSDNKTIDTVEALREDIGLLSDPEEQNVPNSSASTEQRPAPVTGNVTQDVTNPLPGVGADNENNQRTSERCDSAQRGDASHQQTALQQENVVLSENKSPEEAKTEKEASLQQGKKTVSHCTGPEQTAEKKPNCSDEQSKIRSSGDPSHSKQQSAKEETARTSRMTPPLRETDNRSDHHQASHSRAAQGDVGELRVGSRAEREGSDSVRDESSIRDSGSAQASQANAEPGGPRGEARNSPCSIHVQSVCSAGPGSSGVTVDELHTATTDEVPSTVQEQDLDTSQERMQGRVEELREKLKSSITVVPSAPGTPFPSTPLSDDERNRRRTSGHEIVSCEAQPEEPDPVQIYLRTSTPPQMNNETTRYVPTSPEERNDDLLDSEDDQLDSEADEDMIPETDSAFAGITRTGESFRYCPLTTPAEIPQLVDNQPSTHVENMETPAVAIHSTPPSLTPEDPDDEKKREETNYENTGDGCKPQNPQKKDDDYDEGDQNNYSTPGSSHITVGKSRKLSPSASEDQPRKRRSHSGAELEDGETGEDHQGTAQLGGQPTALKCSSGLKVTDKTKLEELASSRSPDRAREYISPPGMPPVSRLETRLPKTLPQGPPLLGSGRRYQRTNVPSEYVPLRLGDLYPSSKSSLSGEEDSLTDDSEAEREVEERANGNALQRREIVQREEMRSLNPSATDAGISGQQKSSLKRSPTPIPPRTNPQVLQIRRKSALPGVKKGEFESPEIEAWIESPKMPSPRYYGNQEVIRAKNTLIYRVPPTTSRRHISARDQIAELSGRDNVTELLRERGGPGRMVRSNGSNHHSRRAANPSTRPNMFGRLNVGQSAGERENVLRNQVAAQVSHTRRETLCLTQLLSARNEAQN